jgi:hypothetical protein
MSPYPVPGGFNSGTQLEQVYRYEVPTNTLACVSCAPPGVTPAYSGETSYGEATGRGNAEMSPLRANEGELQGIAGVVDERGMSSDADRIFFDTPTPLVPQAANAGTNDVYEWENGVVYLISGGKSPEKSYFLDNSENGNDVFFATSEGLVPGDTDGAYDVYDARIPHAGDNPPPAAVPCEGSVCQGPPSVPSPLAAPASATFSGLGNIPPGPGVTPAAKPKATPKVTKCEKGLGKKKSKCIRKPKAKKPAKGRK